MYEEASDHSLRERYLDLVEHIQEPYLTAERRQQISRDMAHISFELAERQKEAPDA